MFDNMIRHFSRRGTDKTEITTTSATIADMDSGYEDNARREYVEQDIDSISLDAPALEEFLPHQDDFQSIDRDGVPGRASDSDIISAYDILSENEVIGNDFEEI